MRSSLHRRGKFLGFDVEIAEMRRRASPRDEGCAREGSKVLPTSVTDPPAEVLGK
jgi:hypothetical protein